MDMDLGALGFWIFLAAIIIAGAISGSRREQMKHETIRRIVEKGGQVDEQQLVALLQPRATDPAHYAARPGGGYRAFRILGVLTLFVAAAISIVAACMFAIILPGHTGSIGVENDVVPVFAVAAGIAVFGCGLFFCSRFLPKPQAEDSGRTDPT